MTFPGRISGRGCNSTKADLSALVIQNLTESFVNEIELLLVEPKRDGKFQALAVLVGNQRFMNSPVIIQIRALASKSIAGNRRPCRSARAADLNVDLAAKVPLASGGRVASSSTENCSGSVSCASSRMTRKFSSRILCAATGCCSNFSASAI